MICSNLVTDRSTIAKFHKPREVAIEGVLGDLLSLRVNGAQLALGLEESD